MRTMAAVFTTLGALACEPVQPCDEYVDYMCRCHADDTGTNCDALATTYQDASPNVQDECAALLNDQEDADHDAGVCAGSTAR